jgi:predicted dehydrogenase
VHDVAGRRRCALVVSGRSDSGHTEALLRALGGVATLRRPGDSLDDLRGYHTVVLDGCQHGWDDAAVTALRDHVEAGATLIAIGVAPERGSPLHDLLGAHAVAESTPEGEVFAKVAAPRHPLVRRLDSEFPVVDRFTPMEPLNGVMAPLLHVNVAHHDHAAALSGRLGRGCIVVTGLGNSERALQAAPLATMLRRAARGEDALTDEKPLGVSILGYGPLGGMGYVHGLAVQGTDGLRLVAACDRAEDRRAAAQRDFPGLRAATSAEEIAADPDVDVVIIATPPVQHAELSLRMLRAGKHVVCEKPLCFTVEQADALIAAARDSGAVLTAYQNRRWDQDFLALRRAVDGGSLGDLFNVETFVGGFEHPCRAWHSDVAYSGGAVYDWGSHHVDWILLLLGDVPKAVTATGHKRVWHDVTNHDQLRLRMAWGDGREAEFLQSDVAAVRRPKFYVQGTRGTLVGWYRSVAFERIEPGRGYVQEVAHHAEAPVPLTLVRYDSGYGLIECHLPPVPEQRFAFHRNLADHLHLGEPLAVTPESVRRVIAVLEAAALSVQRRGRSVPVAQV